MSNAELRQGLCLLWQEIEEQNTRVAALDAKVDEHEALCAAFRSGGDLDIFQAGYERGYRLGWQHAREAKEDPTP
jgi:hypothetical protein